MEVTKDLKEKHKGNRTKEDCAIEAKKYTTRKDFKIYGKGAFLFAYRRGWLEDICSHMKEKPVKWNYELCKLEALKYDSRTNFHHGSGSAYGYALKNNIIEDICSHMPIKGDLFKRMIYCYEFAEDKYVYVGLTYNEKKRNYEHIYEKRGPVAKHIAKTGLTPVYKKLADYTNVKDAKKLEQEYINQYSADGWRLLNKSKAGAIGGNKRIWTKEECHKVALLFNSKIEFKNSKIYGGAVNAASKNGWIEEICMHMEIQNTQWTKEKVLTEALKYHKRIDFMKKSGGAYNAAKRNGYLEEACKHMKTILKKWTKEECRIEAKKYTSRVDFQKNSKGAYLFAYKNKLLNEICSHMPIKIRSWDYKSCKQEALKYQILKDFRTLSGGAYNHASKNGFIKDITTHYSK